MEINLGNYELKFLWLVYNLEEYGIKRGTKIKT
jgi:hypothetical protein